MEFKNIVLILVIIFGIFLLNSIKLFKYNRQYNILFILIAICTQFSVKINFITTQMYYYKVEYFYISTIFIILLSIYIYNFKIFKPRLSLENIFFICIFINMIMSYSYLQIDDKVKFFSIGILYITIYLIYSICRSIKIVNITQILNWFSYFSIINGLLSILQYITNKQLTLNNFNGSILYTEGIEITKRSIGFAISNNAAGNLSAILFAIVLYNFLLNKNKVNFLALVLNIIFSILTLTRIGYLAIVIEIIIVFSMTRWNSIKLIFNKIVIIMSAIIAGIVVYITIFNKIINVLFGQRGDTGSYRFLQFDRVLEYLGDKIGLFYGIGAGQYKWQISNIFNQNEIDLHSQYINILCDHGWIIFILFTIFNICIIVKALRDTNNLERSFIMSLAIGNFICINFNPNQFYYVNNVVYFLIIFIWIYHKKYLASNLT